MGRMCYDINTFFELLWVKIRRKFSWYRKGVFITTSGFTKGAEEYVKTIDSKIILIDGNQLAQYMIEHNVGVSIEKTYEIKRVDSDYFAENTENA